MGEKHHHLQYARVIYVYDAVTMFVETGVCGQKIKLFGINAPRYPSGEWKDSKQFVMETVLSKWVGLENHSQQWDDQGRRLASVWYGEDFEHNLCDNLLLRQYSQYEHKHMNVYKSYHPKLILTKSTYDD